MSSLSKQWRVQYRESFHVRWKKAGLFETRSVARQCAAEMREAYGFRNTRAIPYVRGQK